jgi:hypothetical protein
VFSEIHVGDCIIFPNYSAFFFFFFFFFLLGLVLSPFVTLRLGFKILRMSVRIAGAPVMVAVVVVVVVTLLVALSDAKCKNS